MIIMVTGATAGFGESITRRFIANGHKVIATGRREERLKTLKDELGDNLYIAQLDVRNRAAIETLIADLNSCGHSKLTLKENGDICILQGEELVPQEHLSNFPAKVYWPRLVEVFESNGLAAETTAQGIQVSW